MSIAMSCVILCGALWLKPFSMSCVICVSNVLVEYFGLKPCWVGDSGMYGVIRFSMSRSMTLKAVLNSVTNEVISIGFEDDDNCAVFPCVCYFVM